MTGFHQTEIAVIGAGVVGLAIAHRLARAGHEVVVLDPNPPGSGASYGNAGTIADYAVQPVGTPGVLKSLPSLLFDRTSPLTIRPAALPSLAPWLLRFVAQSLPGPARRNAQALAALLADATPRWQALAADIAGTALMQAQGCLYLYDRPEQAAAAAADLAFRQSLGIDLEMLSATQLAALEPGLPPLAGGAVWFRQAQFLSDPGMMVGLLAKAAWAAGAQYQARTVSLLTRQMNGIKLTGPGLTVTAKKVVIAAGAHARQLALMAGDAVPLDTERGYHLEWDMPTPPLTRPACPTARGFYFCPMTGRLRVAGTVELGGLTAAPSPHRLAKLLEGARAYFPDLGSPDREWMGFRPSMPDSLPVIGTSRAGADVIHAYGHGHIGLTLAPITAEIVADLIAGRTPQAAATPCRVTRF
jgi:D-hydroxyproline dehydrogenase